ncbi:MAG: chitobiase/beta-hexosaminidase C-terminal domain-containing protein, partial [Paludibacteraceae bacterium]|nr:chitobiase/beta-hexosaminidase C-terminal domain-containing protein [Paludibacteraceae bacterium]
MRKFVLFQILLWVLCVSNGLAGIRITEIMTNNVATVVSDQYNYDGYVEFYNDGPAVDLKGWTVVNEKEGQTDWSVVLDSSHVIPNGYSLLFFGKVESGSASAMRVHPRYVGSVGHKLSTDEGMISFSNGGETLELSYPKQYPHIAYCGDGFMHPTPGEPNDELVTSISNRVAKPSFKSGKPGMYDGALSVVLDCETEGAQIYYTLNGDVPTPENGTKYEGSIPVGQTAVVRARAYMEDMLFSEILTGTYILPYKYYEACNGVGNRLPIVSLSANNE